MSEYTYTDADDDTVSIDKGIDDDGEDRAYVVTPRSGAYIPASEAPAAALAILKAAGIEPDGGTPATEPAGAAWFLAQSVKKAAQEAAEAKLDAEALELWKAVTDARDSRESATAVPLMWREKYRDLARAARKLHGKETS